MMPSSEAAAAASSPLQSPTKSLKWVSVLELGYTSDTQSSRLNEPICFHCGRATIGNDKPLLKCANCQVAGYCNKACQIADWKHGGHKVACVSYARVGTKLSITPTTSATTTTPELITCPGFNPAQARDEIFGRVRFYVCPYAVHKFGELGRGFLFVQSDRTLVCLSLGQPTDISGHPTGMRSLLIHYLTLGEYDQEVCRDDFEMASVRHPLRESVESYNEQSEVVVLMRFRCGHVALGISPLCQDYTVCQHLGRSYYANDTSGALQLNLDDL